MYETRVIETSDHFSCEISYKPRAEATSPRRRIRYKHVSNVFQALQAVVIVLAVF